MLEFSGNSNSTLNINKTQRGWSLKVPDGVVMGLQAFAEKPAALIGKRSSGGKLETASHHPAGSPIMYHPPSLGPYPEHIVRRRNGRRFRQHTIFNADDRRIFYPGDFYPWRCAGRLLIWNRPDAYYWDPTDKTGTAALVGRDIVVTSSHMIPDLPKFKAIFLPGLFDTKRSFDQFSYVKTWRRYLPHDQGNDIAILRLYDPIGDLLGWFGTKTYDPAWEDGNYWTRIGYAWIPEKGADGTLPNRVENFPIIDDDGSYGVELEYRSDASPGDSGGPVFGWWDDGPYIVGVHSGGEEEFDLGAGLGRFPVALNNVASGGPALPDLVWWGLLNWK
jgi:hypothetical protein